MYQFIESICCLDGQAQLLDYHQDRVDRTFEEYFYGFKPIVLTEMIDYIPPFGKYKCRIVYDARQFKIDISPYSSRSVQSLKIVTSSDVDYTFKFEDRSLLTQLYSQKGTADDIIIVKNDLITDSYFANIVLFDGSRWITPRSPLLKGIKRQFLLDQGRINEMEIRVGDLNSFEQISLINAMLDLGEVAITMENIQL